MAALLFRFGIMVNPRSILCQYGSIVVYPGNGYPYLNQRFGLAVELVTGVIRPINGTTVWKMCLDWIEQRSLVAAYSLYLSVTKDFYWIHLDAEYLDWDGWLSRYGNAVIPYKSPAL